MKRVLSTRILPWHDFLKYPLGEVLNEYRTSPSSLSSHVGEIRQCFQQEHLRQSNLCNEYFQEEDLSFLELRLVHNNILQQKFHMLHWNICLDKYPYTALQYFLVKVHRILASSVSIFSTSGISKRVVTLMRLKICWSTGLGSPSVKKRKPTLDNNTDQIKSRPFHKTQQICSSP